jgi:hypothetical protein
MRCQACNVALSDNESTKKDEVTGEYYDMCFDCLYSGEEHDDDLEALKSIRLDSVEDCDE